VVDLPVAIKLTNREHDQNHDGVAFDRCARLRGGVGGAGGVCTVACGVCKALYNGTRSHAGSWPDPDILYSYRAAGQCSSPPPFAVPNGALSTRFGVLGASRPHHVTPWGHISRWW